jgi:hypothetical protein
MKLRFCYGLETSAARLIHNLNTVYAYGREASLAHDREGGEGFITPKSNAFALVSISSNRAADIDAEVAELGTQAAPGDTQDLRRLDLVAAGVP